MIRNPKKGDRVRIAGEHSFGIITFCKWNPATKTNRRGYYSYYVQLENGPLLVREACELFRLHSRKDD